MSPNAAPRPSPDAGALASIVTEIPDGAALQVRVVPRAGRSQIAGIRDRALLVRIAAAPVAGAANDAVVDLLARVFDVPRRAVSILHGEKSRDKRIGLSGLSADAVRRRLASLAAGRPMAARGRNLRAP